MKRVVMARWLELYLYLTGVVSFQICAHLIKVSNFKGSVGHEEGDHCQVARVVPHGAVDPTSDQLSNLMETDNDEKDG